MRTGLSRLDWRLEFLRHARGLTWAERLSYVAPRMGTRSIEELIRRRLGRDEAGRPVFLIDGDRIHFLPDGVDTPSEELMRGALLIMEEAYVRPTEFFSPPVVIREGDTVLDLGGNFGTSALRFSREAGPRGRVYSFEPVFHDPLRRTLEANGAAGVTVVPKAVGDRVGEADFLVSALGIDSRFTSDPGRSGARRVATTTLDAFVAAQGLDRVDFIKADIEGAEEMAIRGAKGVIARFRPKWSVASYHTDPEGEPQHPKVARLLASLGYTVREVPGRHIFAW